MFLPNEVLQKYLALLRQCANLKALAEGKRVHGEIVKAGYSGHTFLGNTLVQMYGNCGSLSDARIAFDGIAARNAFSWNILISAHIQNGCLDLAREIFDKMPRRDVVTYNTVSGALGQAGRVGEAGILFETSPERDVVSWNGMITAYAQHGHLDQAKFLLEKSPQFHPVAWTGIVEAYVQDGRIDTAKELFNSMPEQDVVARTMMFSAYAQHGHLLEARRIFDSMSEKDSTSWTAMLMAYANNGNLLEARRLFDQIPDLDTTAYNVMINAYAQNGRMREARRLFEAIPLPNKISWTTMFSAYAKLGDMSQAKEMFDEMPVQDVVAWNAMLSGYAQTGQPREAFKLFKVMVVEGISPAQETFVSAIDACANIPAVLEGKMLHGELTASGVRPDSELQNALVSMYGRFGDVDYARLLFDSMLCRDTVSWTAIVAAYAQNGHTQLALEMFNAMILEGVEPDAVTFINVLAACSHSGLVEEGWRHFVSMNSVHGIDPGERHFVCMIDLLARAGELQLANEVVRNMPYQPNATAWMSMAGACRDQGDIQAGGYAVEYALKHEPDRSPAGYALLSQMQIAGSLIFP